MQRFTNLKVWQRSQAFTLHIYRITASFPKQEQYGLTAQLRRAAASVPTNIAEGSKRQSRAEYARFLNMAEGSLAEVEYLLMLSRDLHFLDQKTAASTLGEADEIARMLNALRARVQGPARTTI
jgi:four helix bundle protein